MKLSQICANDEAPLVLRDGPQHETAGLRTHSSSSAPIDRSEIATSSEPKPEPVATRAAPPLPQIPLRRPLLAATAVPLQPQPITADKVLYSHAQRIEMATRIVSNSELHLPGLITKTYVGVLRNTFPQLLGINLEENRLAQITLSSLRDFGYFRTLIDLAVRDFSNETLLHRVEMIDSGQTELEMRIVTQILTHLFDEGVELTPVQKIRVVNMLSIASYMFFHATGQDNLQKAARCAAIHVSVEDERDMMAYTSLPSAIKYAFEFGKGLAERNAIWSEESFGLSLKGRLLSEMIASVSP